MSKNNSYDCINLDYKIRIRLSRERYLELGHQMWNCYVGEKVTQDEVDQVCEKYADFQFALKDLFEKAGVL